MRLAQIENRLVEIGRREKATQNEQILLVLAQERLVLAQEILALTNGRISQTSPAQTPPGNYPANY